MNDVMSQAGRDGVLSKAISAQPIQGRADGGSGMSLGTAADEAWMYQALVLAEQGHGWVEPNPMVGCVLVKDGRELGRGYHERFGGPHAEVQALQDAQRRGEAVRGATVYVTLEPCCHHGQTPPCCDALIAAEMSRVVIGMVDPNPRVSGKGIERLREAGIEVVVGVCQTQAEQLNEPFVKRVTTGLPWVIAKWASTLDGKTATHTGHSKWISSAGSRQLVHEIRARVDAVMVGIGTVLADDPLLTAREVEVKRVARRVVVDPELRMPRQSKLALGSEPGDPPVTVGVCSEVYQGPSDRIKDYTDHGMSLMPLPRRANHYLEIEPLLRHLAEAHQATNVLVEGGAALLGSMMDQGLVDQVLAFVSPKILGDERGTSAITGQLRDTIDASTMLTLRDIQRIEDDVLLDYRVKKS